jgi:hypothetical protein
MIRIERSSPSVGMPEAGGRALELLRLLTDLHLAAAQATEVALDVRGPRPAEPLAPGAG